MKFIYNSQEKIFFNMENIIRVHFFEKNEKVFIRVYFNHPNSGIKTFESSNKNFLNIKSIETAFIDFISNSDNIFEV